jgi:hypothetical protein
MVIRVLRRVIVGAAVAALVGFVASPVRTLLTDPFGSHGQISQPAVTGLVTAVGHGWSSAGIQGTAPAPDSCHYRHGTGGEPLPDPRCTPGAIDTAVSASTLRSTVCRPGGYTASIRPPEAITEAAKRILMAAYGIPWSQASHYELDHLVAENSGGASDFANLWPQPNVFLNGATGSAFIRNDKDAVEAWTFHKLCARQTNLIALQHAMATNWTTAVAVLHLPRIPAGYRG